MIDFATLQGLEIAEGEVTEIIDAAGNVLWSETIKFTINGDTYIADRGMTWAEWFASDYNTTGKTADDVQSISANGTAVELSTAIVDGTAYEVGFGSYDPVFANNTWEQIITACQNNEIPDTWAVADQKAMTVNGTSYLIDIIGKNHDTYSDGGGKAPLTFQFHDCYNTTYNMNSTNSNVGGWGNSVMRNTNLPIILAKMPSAVKSAIKNVDKLTSAGNASAAINTTKDGLFLLSEVEIFGSATYSVNGEGSQYEYYSNGNSAIKTATSATIYNWWTRSPYATKASYFCCVNRNGASNMTGPTGQHGTAPAFCF